jgi:hypothetical protein
LAPAFAEDARHHRIRRKALANTGMAANGVRGFKSKYAHEISGERERRAMGRSQ